VAFFAIREEVTKVRWDVVDDGGCCI